MIRDNRLTFSQTVSPLPLNTGAAGDYQIGDIIDLGATGRDLGAGESAGDIFLLVQVATDVQGGSCVLSLATSDSASLASPVKVAASLTAVGGSAPAGTRLFAARLPSTVYKRYIGIVQTTTTAITSGSVYAFFAEDLNAIRYYPQAFS